MSVTETETAVPPCARAWPSLDFSPSFTVGTSHAHTMSITEKGFGEAGNSGQCDIMRGTGSDWAPHSRHTGDIWLQWPWEGREAQDPPQTPARSRDARGPGLGTGGCPPRGTSPLQENWLALKSRSVRWPKSWLQFQPSELNKTGFPWGGGEPLSSGDPCPGGRGEQGQHSGR